MNGGKVIRGLASLILLLCLGLPWVDGPATDLAVLVGLLALALMRTISLAAADRSQLSATAICLVLIFAGYASLQWRLGLPPTVAGVCLLTGLGWLTHWFPIPRLPREYRNFSFRELFLGYLVPMLLTAVVFDRLAPRFVGHGEIQAVFMPVAVLPLILAAVRMHFARTIREMLAYSAVIPVCAGMATLSLSLWDLDHATPNLTLESAAPLLSGREILQWSIITFTGSWLVTAAGAKLQEGERVTTGRILVGLGVLSLIGIPPFPGYWWRLALLSALTIPHSRSRLTWLYEVVPGNFLFAGLLAAGFIFVMIAWLGQLRCGPRVPIRRPLNGNSTKATS